MPFVPLPRFLVRAPLLPLPPFARDPARRLLDDPLGAQALALASPTLAAAAAGDARAARARARYGQRAAFRPTPSGLLAGVAVGALGRETRAATGRPRARLDLAWWRVAALGRALLDDAGVRAQARLRHAPSLLRGPGRARWMAFHAPVMAAERQAEVDARLARLLDACRGWTPWPAARAAAGGSDDTDDDDTDALDDLLLTLIDDGLLHSDLTPPLIGPDATSWMTSRLARLRPPPDAAAALAAVRAALDAGDEAGARAALGALPGAGDEPGDDPIAAVLIHQPTAAITLDRRAVERAAQLGPLLFRLQEALAPPACERLANPAVRAAAAAAGELYGEGALELAALALGDYGVDVADSDGDRDDAPDAPGLAGPPPALLRLLVDEIAAARAAGDGGTIALSAGALDAVLPAAAAPATFELFLTPAPARPRARAKARPGDGWLIGLHAPAGASWGRFATALGAPLKEALRALADAEAAARPDEQRLDVAFAPSPGLADLCAHPPLRRRVLALSGWPAHDGDGASAPDVVTPAELELVVDGGAEGADALLSRAAGGPVVPSPLARVRSSTAPAGAFRLLAGWSLHRQHSPWALALGPLADLAHVPRVAVDGFVISPASWRIPRELPSGTAGRAALRRWRRGGPGVPPVPRFVQVGVEDLLLPVDLDDPAAPDDLAASHRAWEIWPPVTARGGAAATVDRDGRRLEAVVAVVDVPDADDRNRAATRARTAAGRVPPPRAQPAADGWRTFKLFGAPDDDWQDDLLLDGAWPAIEGALAERERQIDAWFFQRYVDGPGRRPHLRLRVHAATDGGLDAFAARLERGLAAARASGALAAVETAPYFRELARFGGAGATAAAERIFQSSSELACALLGAARRADDATLAPDTLDLLVVALDALAAGFGLGDDERRALARRRRDAFEALAPPDLDERRALDGELRGRAPGLRAALGPTPPDALAGPVDRHRRRVAQTVAALDAAARAHLLPELLHLDAVRFGGPHRALEARACFFWERTLEGLLATAAAAARGPRRPARR
jgi:thiopeptide-type bacteriocin biosynthesis protein